jgi:hypothetical protein
MMYGDGNIADGRGESKPGDATDGVRAMGIHRAHGLRDQPALRSEEAPTLMALGGFEQVTLNPCCAEGPGPGGTRVAPLENRRWPAMNGISCAPRAACFTANPRASAINGLFFTRWYMNRRAGELRQN